MTRRLFLLAFAVTTLTQTGCCGRVRAFFYRVTHCAPGCCYPAFGCPDAGCAAPAPIYAAAHPPAFDAGHPVGPMGAPGCSTCYSGGPQAGIPMAGVPVVPPGGPIYPMGGTAPPPQQMAPPNGPGVYSTPMGEQRK